MVADDDDDDDTRSESNKKRTYLTTCALQHVCTKAAHLIQAASSIKLKLIKTFCPSHVKQSYIIFNLNK